MSLRYVQPVFPFLLLVALVSLVLAARRRDRRWVAVTFWSVLLIWCWSWPPLHYFLSLPFESPYARPLPPDAQIDAIVVLSGSIRTSTVAQPYAAPGHDTYLRCLHAAWLFRNRFPVPVVATGGGLPGQAAGEVSAELLVQLGVPREMILVENRSRSTWENALFAAELLRERGLKRVAVVTQAYHMRRAVAVFRRLGFEVVPAACDFHIDRGPFHEFLPDGTTIRSNELLLHELIGYLWYWLKGRV